MEELETLIGREVGLDETVAALRQSVLHMTLPAVGAHLVTCSDESEIECADAFQRGFVEPLLPNLGPEKCAAFRTANLGSRYEWGSARIAEHHYATPDSRQFAKCVVIKINGHVSVLDTPQGRQYGPMARYETQSAACGALHALLGGAKGAFADDLRDALCGDGQDRIAILLNQNAVASKYRYLAAAIVSARRQAERALRDIEEYTAATPTVYVIAPCVTLNRPGPDGELLVGFYAADFRGATPNVEYAGLGDDPAKYRFDEGEAGLAVVER